jgi:hypothetical protein
MLLRRPSGAPPNPCKPNLSSPTVSDYALHNLTCPVIVVKGAEGTLPSHAPHAAGAAAAVAAREPATAGAGPGKHE